MDRPSTQAQEIARLRSETALLRKKRYRGLVTALLAGAGLAADLAGLPFSVSLAFWGVGLAAWFAIKAM